MAHHGPPQSAEVGGSSTNTPLLACGGLAAGIARFAAAMLVVGVFAAGADRPSLSAWSGGRLWGGDEPAGQAAAVWPLLVAGAVLVVLLVLLLAVQVRRRRRRPEDEWVHEQIPIPWTTKAAMVAVALAVFAGLGVAAWYLLRTSSPDASGEPSPTAPGESLPVPPPGGQPAVPGVSHLWWLVAAVAVVAVLLLLGGRAVRAARRSQTAPTPAPQPVADTALAAGLAALREPADDREAIIACYVAMERELDRLGVHRSPAQTATELLARAAGSRLIHSPAAGELVGLFHRARHSSHPIGPAERRAAEHALAALSGELAGSR
jgi:heme/copper-type cytochrome/quinol oxidase subunit 2